MNCRVTESTAAETDPRFVNTIWEGSLELPSGRPANQEIQITFSYDDNQVMKCSFVDVATGKETKIDLSLAASGSDDSDEIEKFLVEWHGRLFNNNFDYCWVGRVSHDFICRRTNGRGGGEGSCRQGVFL